TRIPTEEITLFEQLAEGLCVPASILSLFIGIMLLSYGIFGIGGRRTAKSRIPLALAGVFLIGLAGWAMLSVWTVGMALKPVVTILSVIFAIVFLTTGVYILAQRNRNLRTGAGCLAAAIALLCVAGIFIRESIEIMSPMAPILMLIFAGAGCILSFMGTFAIVRESTRVGIFRLIPGLALLTLAALMYGGAFQQNIYALALLFIAGAAGMILVISGILNMAFRRVDIVGPTSSGLILLGIASSLLYMTNWVGNYAFLLLSVSAAVAGLAATGRVWIMATVDTQKKYQSAAASGLSEEYGDPQSRASDLAHVPGEKIFREWRANLTALKEAELFMPESLLKSFKYAGDKKFYGGLYEADEEVEYFREDRIVQKLNQPYQLNEDPKPVPPNSFTNETQIYPYSQFESECSDCKGTGKVSCPKCGGSGKKQCSRCGGKGYTRKAVKKEGYTPAYHGPTQAVIYETEYKLSSGVKIKGPHVETIGSSHGGMRLEPFEIKEETCTSCNGSGLSNEPCDRCRGTGEVTCQECDGAGKLRVIKRKIWEYKHERDSGTVLPSGCFARPLSRKYLRINEQEFEKIDALNFPDEDKNANPPSIKEILKKLRGYYEKWLARKKGRVVLNAHRAYIFPVTECIVEYPAEKGKKKFSVWGVGNLRAWVISAETTPIKKTPKFFLRHVLFSLITVSEVIAAIIIHRVFIFT
ncbi:MAG: hypothetical protein N3F63_05025, partial [Thermoplasmata archaeon]|nr:hypothetical protein [Thermoplasmata archaeon]